MNANKFELVGESGTYVAVKIHANLNTSSLDGPSSMPGLPSYRLTDGRRLNFVDSATFEIVDTGEILKVRV